MHDWLLQLHVPGHSWHSQASPSYSDHMSPLGLTAEQMLLFVYFAAGAPISCNAFIFELLKLTALCFVE